MARNVFVSFRFSDGEDYKDELCRNLRRVMKLLISLKKKIDLI